MRGIAMLCWFGTLATLVACSRSEMKRPDTTAVVAAGPATPQGTPVISLASVAGKWNMRVANQAGDSTLMTEVINATADTSGWTDVMPGREPIPVRVTAVAGDSIVTESGPFASALRKGVQVTTHTVYRLQNGKLVSTTVAHYTTKGPDSVLTVHSEGTRAP